MATYLWLSPSIHLFMHPFIQQLFIVHLTWVLCGGDATVDVIVYSRM